MNIILSPEQEQIIHEQLQKGQYNSVEQVITEALLLLVERNQLASEIQLSELREKICVGTEQVRNGQVTDGELVFERLQAKIHKQYGER